MPESHSRPENSFLDKFNLTTRPQAPIAFYPTMDFPRMVSQLSVFTIHPDPRINSTAKSITDLLTHKESLVRYIIPAKCKRKMLRDLYALGISRGTIYQDLDSLCIDMVQSAKEEYNAWFLPSPPMCSGEYDE
jgi:hypothetical protein